MPTPVVTPQLAEKALTGAAVHGLSVRAASGVDPATVQRDLADYRLFRDGTDPAELAVSLTAYAVTLTWWYATDHTDRLALLERAMELMLESVSEHPADAAELACYRQYALWVIAAATITAETDELHLGHFACAKRSREPAHRRICRRPRPQPAVAGHNVFGDPHTSAETLRNLMTTLAYTPVRA